MLFKERRRGEAKSRAEQAGESLWTSRFSPTLRNRIWLAFHDSFRREGELVLENRWGQVCDDTRAQLTRDMGLRSLRGISDGSDDLDMFLQTCDDEEVCSVIEAMVITIHRVAAAGRMGWIDHTFDFEAMINESLYRERASYELVEGEMIEKESEELHAAVVAPALRLLAGRAGWEPVEAAYRKALEEISDGAADDAITDAGSALQEALALLGCEGNSLGPQIKSAREQGILAPHDQTLATGIAKIMDWVSADRSELGDGHQGASGANRDDAWLIVHVVGALILRLAEGPRAA